MPTVLIGYDGSDAAERALHAARAVLSAERAVVATVWEPNLPALAEPGIGDLSLSGAVVDPETMRVLDDDMERSARRTAAAGAELARAAGFVEVVEVVEVDLSDVADALIRIATAQAVDAIAVGSHGRGGVLARVMGTTSTSLVQRATCPVLVSPAPR